MARITAAKMTAGSIVATGSIAYIKTSDGRWNGTDGKQYDNAHIEKLLISYPFLGSVIRIGTGN